MDIFIKDSIEILCTIVLATFAFVVLWKIIKGRINLNLLLSEDDGKASMSRLQFFLFTILLAAIYAKYSFEASAPPNIPDGWWQLLGISGGSYVASKAIQNATNGASAPAIKQLADPSIIDASRSDGSSGTNGTVVAGKA